MPISGNEKSKAEKLISKIESGNFDENDVDALVMRLRAFADGYKVFREVANFVAHNDIRDRGVLNEAVEAMYLSMKFFVEYHSIKKQIDIENGFPVYIKKLIKYQIDRADKVRLRAEFNVTPDRLKNRVDKHFIENKKTGVAKHDGKISNETLGAIGFVLGFIHSRPAFTGQEFVEEVLLVIKKNKLAHNENNWREQSDRLSLCVLAIIHNTVFDYKGYRPGRCSIGCETPAIAVNVRYVDENGNELPPPITSHGTLDAHGIAVVEKEGRDLNISFPLFQTNLKVEDWCDENLIELRASQEGSHTMQFRTVNFDGALGINHDFKLYRLPTEAPTQ
jgi:hypothetical protein